MNLISSDDLSRDQINRIFKIADDLKDNRVEITIKEHATMALLFEKPSLRTRVSFEVAMAQLGGHSIYLEKQTTHIGTGETLADTARVLSSYCDFIVVRTFEQSEVMEIAENSTAPVINALTDVEHPTQALTDVYTILQHTGKLKDTKIAFLGPVWHNVANSLMLIAAKLGAEVALVGPKDAQPNSIYFNKAREYSKVSFYDSIEEGLEDAEIVYTDTFIDMGHIKGSSDYVKTDQEKHAEELKRQFAPYQLNAKAMSYASKTALVMHDLPAHRGQEITDEMIDGPRSIVWEQAANKLLMAKAILLYLSEGGRSR